MEPSGVTRRAGSAFVAALSATALLRVFYSAVCAVAGQRLSLDAARMQRNAFTDTLIQRGDTWRYLLLGVWQKFDTLWYVHVAQQGYDRPAAVVFYPMYPALMRLAGTVVSNPLAAALLVSTIAAFLLFWGFSKLTGLDLPADATNRALLLYAVWPASFVFFAGYAESLLLALILWAIYFARVERWWFAGVLGLLAGLTKAIGFVVIVPLVWIAWQRRAWGGWPVLLALLGPASFLGWLKITGRMSPSEVYPRYWATQVVWPWKTIWDIIAQAASNPLLPLFAWLFMMAALPALTHSTRTEYRLYAIAVLVIVLTKHTQPLQQSWARYLLVLFPAPAAIAQRYGTRDVAILAALCFAANVLLLWGFLNWFLVV